MLNCRSFTFEGQSSEDFDIFIGYIGDPSVVNDHLYTADIVETRIPSQIRPIYFGQDKNKAVERDMTLCSDHYLTREEIDAIFAWLTCSTNGYGELIVEDGDELEEFTMRVIFQSMELVNSAWPIAIQCKVVCDSQWAYATPIKSTYNVVDGIILTSNNVEKDMIMLNNESSYLGYIYPTLTLEIAQGTTHFAMTNITDDSRKLSFDFSGSFTPTDGGEKLIITIDTQRKIMNSNCTDVDPYKCLSDLGGYFYFPRLLRGENEFIFEGSALCSITFAELKGVGL